MLSALLNKPFPSFLSFLTLLKLVFCNAQWSELFNIYYYCETFGQPHKHPEKAKESSYLVINSMYLLFLPWQHKNTNVLLRSLYFLPSGKFINFFFFSFFTTQHQFLNFCTQHAVTYKQHQNTPHRHNKNIYTDFIIDVFKSNFYW